MPPNNYASNIGTHIGHRLVEIGCTSFFGVPGDFNLLLLDQFLKVPGLQSVWCCNELNAGYAADGYARQKGIACVVVTFCVGGFSVLNAIGGAYSEDLPVIVISGGPNSNDFASNRILHHTTGHPHFHQQLNCFKEVTCHAVVVNHIENAHRQIDTAISTCLLRRKPVYIEISCNIAAMRHPSFSSTPVPYVLDKVASNPTSLKAAVEEAAQILNSAVRPTLLAGVRLRQGSRRDAFMTLAKACQYPVAILPDAKGMVPETYERFMGLYWGCVSSPCVCEVVESSDVVLTAGAVWSDVASVGYSVMLPKVIAVGDSHVVLPTGHHYECVKMDDFLVALADKLTPNDTAFVNFKRLYVPPAEPPSQKPDEQLRCIVLYKHIQHFLTGDHCLFAEVGDSWFNTQKLRLPEGCGYEMQMRYGSIGWSVGAVLGYSIARGNSKRVVACIGDGSFQMTAQEVSTMIRYGLNPVIFLINNGGYTIEVEIHDGPYNVIKNWNYTALIESMCNEEGKLWTAKAKTEAELVTAIEGAKEHADQLVFIEVFLHKDDCSKELFEWGSRAAVCGGRPPK